MNKFKKKLETKIEEKSKANTQNVKQDRVVDLILDELVILPKFRDLLPKPTDSERLLLKKRLQEGWNEAIDVWDDKANQRYVLIDGHNRMDLSSQIEKESGTPCKPGKITKHSFDSEEEVIEWILEKNFARRSLSPSQKSIFIGLEFESRKGKQGRGTNLTKELAEKYGVSESTIEKDSAFVRSVREIDKYLPKIKLFDSFKNGYSELNKSQVAHLAKQGSELKQYSKSVKSADDLIAIIQPGKVKSGDKKNKKAPIPQKDELAPIIESSLENLKVRVKSFDHNSANEKEIKATIKELTETAKYLKGWLKSK